MNPAFAHKLPPLPEVYSFDPTTPCRQAPHSTSVPSGQLPACPLRKECLATLYGSSIPLTFAYPSGLRVTLTELSSSIVIRSEHLYQNNDHLRLALRKHIHELKGLPHVNRPVLNDTLDAVVKHSDHALEAHVRSILSSRGEVSEDAFEEMARTRGVHSKDYLESIQRQLFRGTHCALSSSDTYGQYVGFIDIRLNAIHAPIAMGVLAPPHHLRYDPTVRCITGEYAPIFGSHTFPSSIYSMHDPELSGARCAQACCVMALGLLSDRRAKILGSYELTQLAKVGETTNETRFRIEGLRIQEILDVLRNHAGVSPFTPNWSSLRPELMSSASRNPRHVFRLMERLVESYVVARFPVIVLVDLDTFNQEFRETEIANSRSQFPSQGECHAVLIAGIKYLADAAPSSSLVDPPKSVSFLPDVLSHYVLHDPSLQPFALWPTDAVFDASIAFGQKLAAEEGRSGPPRYIFVADKRIQTHLYECISRLYDFDFDENSPTALEHANSEEVRLRDDEYTRRVHDESQISMYLICEGTHELRCTLVEIEDLASLFFANREGIGNSHSSISQADFDRILSVVRSELPSTTPRHRYWAIAGYVFVQEKQGSRQERRLETLWLYDAEDALPQEELGQGAWWRLHVAPLGTVQIGTYVTPRIAPESGEGLVHHLPDSNAELTAQRQSTQPIADEMARTDSASEERTNLNAEDSVKPIRPSVITSSSNRSLKELLVELGTIDSLGDVDVYLLRDIDVREIPGLLDGRDRAIPINTSAGDIETTKILANPNNIRPIADWLFMCFDQANARLAQLKREPILIPAFATYCPLISHPDINQAAESVSAIVNCVQIAHRTLEALSRRWPYAGYGPPIVEMVCGSRLAVGSNLDEVKVVSAADVAKTLAERLGMIAGQLDEVLGKTAEWALGLEMEPGTAYALTKKSLRQIFTAIDNFTTQDSAGKTVAPLEGRIGLNVDVAHFGMEDIQIDAYRRLIMERAIHAHICDHPGMHTRDQWIGRWTPLEGQITGDLLFVAELQRLSESKHISRKVKLPFSGCVALELEGCNRVGWIHRSIAAMRQLFSRIARSLR